MHVGLGVAIAGHALVERAQFQGLAAVFAAETIHGNVACGLVQVGAWLLDLLARVFQYPDKGIVGEVLGLLSTAQLARPGADQLMVVVEEAFGSGHGRGHQGGRQGCE
ncbi:hypothetical protein D3C71_1871420 [compost metagenome]